MNLYSLITRSLHVFTVSRPQLASKHTRLQLAARPGRHPAATDEGREVQSASNRPATDHRFYSHIETSTLKTHTGLECLKKKKLENYWSYGHTVCEPDVFLYINLHFKVLHERFSWDKQCKKSVMNSSNCTDKVPVLKSKEGRAACERASHRTR